MFVCDDNWGFPPFEHHQLEQLLKQNAVLLRNMSILFKTAQLEIGRKDTEISRLRQLYAVATSFPMSLYCHHMSLILFFFSTSSPSALCAA
jgi:hypothetical protein